MFQDINTINQLALNNVKASASVNSPNDGGFNSEENFRWANRKLTTKPFIFGETEEDVSKAFGSSVSVGWYGAYGTSALINLDGYFIKVANKDNLSYDEHGVLSGPDINLMPAQKFISGLMNSGTDLEIPSALADFLFSEYVPTDYEDVTPELQSKWSSAIDSDTIIGFIRNTCVDTYAAELTSTSGKLKYENTEIVVDNSITITDPDSLKYISGETLRTDPVAQTVESEGTVTRADIYYPVRLKSVKRYNGDTNTYTNENRMYFTDIFGIEYTYGTASVNTHNYPYTFCQFATMETHSPLQALGVSSCDTTTYPSKLYDFTKLYTGDGDTVTRKTIGESVDDTYNSSDFPSFANLTNFFGGKLIRYTISDLLSFMPAVVPESDIKKITNNLSYYCLNLNSGIANIKSLLLKSEGGDQIPVTFISSDGAITPDGFIGDEGVKSKRYPLEGYMHFIKRLYVLYTHPQYAPHAPTEDEISAVTLKQLTDWVSADHSISGYDGNSVNVTFTTFYNTYLYPCICAFINLAYSSLMDNVVYTTAATNALQTKACGCGNIISGLPGIEDDVITSNQQYVYTGYTNVGGVMTPDSAMVAKIEYHKDSLSDYHRVFINPQKPPTAEIIPGYNFRATYSVAAAKINNKIALYFEDPINYIRRCMVKPEKAAEYSGTFITSYYVYNGSALTEMQIQSTPYKIKLDDYLFPATSQNTASGTGIVSVDDMVGRMGSVSEWMLNGAGIYNSPGNGMCFTTVCSEWSPSLPYVVFLRKDSLNYLSGRDYVTGKYGGVQFGFRLSKNDITTDELLLFCYNGTSTPSVQAYDRESFNFGINYYDYDVKTAREAFIHASKVYDDNKKELSLILREIADSIDTTNTSIQGVTERIGEVELNLGNLTETVTNPETGIAAQVESINTEINDADTGIDARLGAIEDQINDDDGIADTVEQLDTDINTPNTGLLAQAYRLLETGLLSEEGDPDNYVTYHIYGNSLSGSDNVCYIRGYGNTDTSIESLRPSPLINKGIRSVIVEPGVIFVTDKELSFPFNDLHVSCTYDNSVQSDVNGAGYKYITIDDGAVVSITNNQYIKFASIPPSTTFTNIYRCVRLQKVEIHSPVLYCISECNLLEDVIVGSDVKVVGDDSMATGHYTAGRPFLNDDSLYRLTYLGMASEWAQLTKSEHWDVTAVDESTDTPLSWITTVVCLDNTWIRNSSTGVWELQTT